MNTTHTRTKFAAVVGAAIAGAVAPALLFLGAGTAQATQDDPGFKVGIHDVAEMPIRCQSRLVLCAGPQPDPPGIALPPVQMIGPYGPNRALPEFGHAVEDAEPPPSPRP
jgi:hypothetical protein